MEYAWTLFEARRDHFKSEFFDKISTKLNTMEEGKDMQDFMITKPNKQQFVFVRFYVNINATTMRRGLESEFEIEIKEDNIYLLPFDEVKPFI